MRRSLATLMLWLLAASPVIAQEIPGAASEVEEATEAAAAGDTIPPTGPTERQAEPAARSGSHDDRILAVVGDRLLLESEWREQTQLLASQYGVAPGSPEYGTIAGDAFDQMVQDLVIVAAAERDTTIQIPPERVQEATDDEVAAIRERFPSEQEFLDQLRQSQWGSLAAYRADIQERRRRELLGQAFLEKHRAEIRPMEVSEEEVREFWEANRATLGTRPETFRFEEIAIVPSPSEAAREAARAEAEATRDEIEAGRDFASAAREHNPDDTASKGGDLGWFGRGQMVPAFEEVAFETPIGELAGPVETRYGFHLVQPIDEREDEVRARHVLIPFAYEQADFDRARTRADSVAALVAAGADVDSLQAVHMGDDSLATSVLDLDPRQLPPAYARALETMQAGDVRTIEVPTAAGIPSFNVLVSRGTSGGGTLSFDEMAERIRNQLAQQRAEAAFVERLEEDVYVDIRVRPDGLPPTT